MSRLRVPSRGQQSSHNACVLHITVRCSHYPIYTRIYLCNKNSKPPTSAHTTNTPESLRTRLWNGSWFHANLKSLLNLPLTQNLSKPDVGLYWTISFSSFRLLFLSSAVGGMPISASPSHRTLHNPYTS